MKVRVILCYHRYITFRLTDLSSIQHIQTFHDADVASDENVISSYVLYCCWCSRLIWRSQKNFPMDFNHDPRIHWILQGILSRSFATRRKYVNSHTQYVTSMICILINKWDQPYHKADLGNSHLLLFCIRAKILNAMRLKSNSSASIN